LPTSARTAAALLQRVHEEELELGVTAAPSSPSNRLRRTSMKRVDPRQELGGTP
jgi:hypothetical protein